MNRECGLQMGVAKWGRECGSRMGVANGSHEMGSQMGVAKVGRENKKSGAYVNGIPKGVII